MTVNVLRQNKGGVRKPALEIFINRQYEYNEWWLLVNNATKVGLGDRPAGDTDKVHFVRVLPFSSSSWLSWTYFSASDLSNLTASDSQSYDTSSKNTLLTLRCALSRAYPAHAGQTGLRLCPVAD